MKNLRLTAAIFFITALFAISAFAQAPAQTSKIYVIDTLAFSDENEGIKKFINASKQLETEFKPRATELNTLGTKINAMNKEIQTLRDQFEKNPQGPISRESIVAKIDEYQKMETEFKRKKEDYDAAIAKRGQTLLDPVREDIYKAMGEFAKQKKYPIILDLGQMIENKLILAVGDESIDVTKEFITFYNARPAASASATR